MLSLALVLSSTSKKIFEIFCHLYLLDVLISHYWSEYPPITGVNNFICTSVSGCNILKLVFTPVRLRFDLILFNTKNLYLVLVKMSLEAENFLPSYHHHQLG